MRFKTCSFSRSVIHPSHQISNTLCPWFDVGRSTALYKILDSSESKFVFMLYILFDRIYCIGKDSATARAHSPKHIVQSKISECKKKAQDRILVIIVIYRHEQINFAEQFPCDTLVWTLLFGVLHINKCRDRSYK